MYVRDLGAALAAIALAAVACSKQTPPAPVGPSTPAAAAPTAAPDPAASTDAAAASSIPVVTLLEAGRAPRALIRYHVPAGAKKVAVVDVNMAMTNESPGAPAMPKMPTMRMLMEMQSSLVASADAMPVVSKVISAEIKASPEDSPQLVAALSKELGKIVGMTVTGTLMPRGFWRDVKVDVPPGVAPQVASMMTAMRSSIQQSACTWPAEAIGEGARWRIDSVIDNAMLKVNQSSAVTLVKRTGDQVVLAFEITQTAPAQAMQVPNQMPGMSVTLDKFEGAGTAQMTADLAGLVPKAAIALTSKIAMTIKAQGNSVPTQAKNDFRIEMAPQAK